MSQWDPGTPFASTLFREDDYGSVSDYDFVGLDELVQQVVLVPPGACA